MKLSVSLVALSLYSGYALAAVPVWGKCGGTNYTGETTCATGSICTYQNDYYSQCIPGTATTVASTTTAATTSAPPPPPTTTAPPASTSFVKTSGTQLTLNGSRFNVAGSNSYWVGLMGLSTAKMNKASPTSSLAAQRSFAPDNVVAAAKANGLRLIVALTNNWSDYGGMDVHIKQILNSANHDLFYTDASVKNAFKSYIKSFVGRYMNEPTIMAWELANEPRCSSGTSSGTCTTITITNWAKEISAYIKSIDSNHLIALGDEGFYIRSGVPTYPYQGSEGIDFDANLAISTLDFGTFHSYPTPWGQGGNEQAWGTQWITDHAASMTKANKPVILEEFGVTNNQATIYTAWLNQVISSVLTGI